MDGSAAKTSPQGYVVIHGHFYQPPRENPWIEQIEVEPSAAPFHDWNARITTECYRPNGVARVYDGQERILDIVNNYRYLSFNFGPTLISWLEDKAP
jgi:alpha-amylase/alpha-mannosidase (GH57 family)